MSLIKSIFSIIYATLFLRKRFYCEVDLGGTFIFKIWERPSRWLPDNILQTILSDVHTIMKAAQDTKETPNYGILTGEKSDLDNRLLAIAYEKKTGKPIGFGAQSLMLVPTGRKKIEILHLGLMVVAKEYQNKTVAGLMGVLPNLVLLVKRGFRPIWISNVSQVPCVIGIVGHHYSDVFPNPIYPTQQTPLHQVIFEGIMREHRHVFGTGAEATCDVQRQIIFNSYTGGSDTLKKTFEACAKHRDHKVNLFCQNNLDYERGDDFLQIGRLSLHSIYVFIRRKIKIYFRFWIADFGKSKKPTMISSIH